MAIRRDSKDLSAFPFDSKDRGIWYFFSDWRNKQTIEFKSSHREELLAFLKTTLDKGESADYTMFGVWTGNWKTDIFEMSLQDAYEKINIYIAKP